MTNKAANELRESMYDLAVTSDHEAFLLDLDAALNTERKATLLWVIELLWDVDPPRKNDDQAIGIILERHALLDIIRPEAEK